MYLNYDEILSVIEDGAMANTSTECVNAASLDIRLGESIMVETWSDYMRPLDYSKRDKLCMNTVKLSPAGYKIRPGEFFLAHTIEVCNFPDDLAALFRIKSSMGRIGLEHMDAGWIDPGFNGALTLEFKNMTTYHDIIIRPGDRIGQLIFLRGKPVSEEQSYRTKGNYNGSTSVKQVGYETTSSKV